MKCKHNIQTPDCDLTQLNKQLTYLRWCKPKFVHEVLTTPCWIQDIGQQTAYITPKFKHLFISPNCLPLQSNYVTATFIIVLMSNMKFKFTFARKIPFPNGIAVGGPAGFGMLPPRYKPF